MKYRLSLTYIGEGAFAGCKLTSITIPQSVNNIKTHAFSGCPLEKIEVENGNTTYDSRNNCNAIIWTRQDSIVLTCANTTIPNDIKSIGSYAFAGRSDMTSINIPNTVEAIGEYAFSGCTGLTSVTLPDKLKTLGNGAFNGCTNITSINIPDNVRDLGETVFDGCGLEKITVSRGNSFYDSRDNCNAVIITGSDSLIIGCKNTVIPNSVKGIGASAFYECTGLTSIEIPSSVENIGASAFLGCTELTSVEIPGSVKTIGDWAFYACTNLASAAFAEGLKSINASAFRNCSSLKAITIPNSVESIGEYAFADAFPFIICDNPTPPSASYNAFYSSYYDRKPVALVPESAVADYQKARGWNYCVFNAPFKVSSTQTSITLITTSAFSNTSAQLDGRQYVPQNDTIKITGLTPGTSYVISTSGTYNDMEFNPDLTVRTKNVYVDLNVTEKTNTTITLRPYQEIGDVVIADNGIEGYATTRGTDQYGRPTFKIEGLKPGEEYEFTYYFLTPDGYRFTQKGKFQTTPIDIRPKVIVGAANCELTVEFSTIDATVVDFGFIGKPQQTQLHLTGLDPETIYTNTFYVDTQEGGRTTADATFMTMPLIFATSAPKVISAGNVIVAAESNIDDEETNVGFEWRREDWPDNITSNTGGAYLYEGTMEGYIRNLYTGAFWKFRPYYLSNSGTYYYGDWMGVDPTNTSYFEPTVHTYARINIEGNTALVRGYALRGTDNVTVQGFMYWRQVSEAKEREDGEHRAPAVPKDALTVEASGQVMEAQLTGLDYEATYCYVAFVKTSEGETFYGETQTFTTGADVTGIGEIAAEPTDSPQSVRRGIYTLQGVKVADDTTGLKTLPRGVYIVDGKKRGVK